MFFVFIIIKEIYKLFPFSLLAWSSVSRISLPNREKISTSRRRTVFKLKIRIGPNVTPLLALRSSASSLDLLFLTRPSLIPDLPLSGAWLIHDLVSRIFCLVCRFALSCCHWNGFAFFLFRCGTKKYYLCFISVLSYSISS